MKNSKIKATALGLALLTALAAPVVAQGLKAGPGPFAGPGPSFAEIDTNGDGQITVEEFNLYRQGPLAKADTDGDGTVSKDELIAAMSMMQQMRMERQAARMIEQLDKNGDGVLSVEELSAMGPSEQGMSRMLARVDANNDGMVGPDEFDQMGPQGGMGPKGHRDGYGMGPQDGFGPKGEGRGHGEHADCGNR